MRRERKPRSRRWTSRRRPGELWFARSRTASSGTGADQPSFAASTRSAIACANGAARGYNAVTALAATAAAIGAGLADLALRSTRAARAAGSGAPRPAVISIRRPPWASARQARVNTAGGAGIAAGWGEGERIAQARLVRIVTLEARGGGLEGQSASPSAGERRILSHCEIEGGEGRAGGESGVEGVDVFRRRADISGRPGRRPEVSEGRGRRDGHLGQGTAPRRFCRVLS